LALAWERCRQTDVHRPLTQLEVCQEAGDGAVGRDVPLAGAPVAGLEVSEAKVEQAMGDDVYPDVRVAASRRVDADVAVGEHDGPTGVRHESDIPPDEASVVEQRGKQRVPLQPRHTFLELFLGDVGCNPAAPPPSTLTRHACAPPGAAGRARSRP